MLNKQNIYCPIVKPVPDGIARPLWSVMIPTYNCATYLRETLASVLAQDLGADLMQIMIIDDCSDDNPEAVVEELGKGRVEFYRQPQNVGIPHNFQTSLEKSRGYLVHQLHGDDVVRDTFYQKMQEVFERHPEIGAAFCRTIVMDEYGHWQWITGQELNETGVLPSDWIQKLAGLDRIMTPSMVVRRETYEKLGGFDHRLRTTEDWEMWVRIAANYAIAHEIEPLALYRQRSNSNMHSNMANGRHAEQMYRAITLFESYLADRIPAAVYAQAKQNSAFIALQGADFCMREGNPAAAITQIKSAIGYSPSLRVIRSAGRILLWNGTLRMITSMTRRS
jgi:glycosyltransferase involved in cell wall biosynthesis